MALDARRRPLDLARARRRCSLACFMAVWYGSAESDGYNALTLNAGLAWRDIALLAHLSRYLRQAGAAYSQHYMWATLTAIRRSPRRSSSSSTPASTPARPTRTRPTEIAGKIDSGARSGREPRRGPHHPPLRSTSIDAIVRTNFFQLGQDGAPHARDRLQARLRSGSRACRRRGRSARSSSTARASKACICASARWRAAASAGRTGRRISAPRCSASPRRSRSRTR